LANRSIAAYPTYKYDNIFCQCFNCGFVFISTHYIICPFCESKNLFGVPFRDHKHFSFRWLEINGFPHIKNLVGGENSLLSEMEVKNIIENERMKLEQIVNSDERKLVGAFIAGLECVLNE